MENFEIYNPTRIIFGKDAIDRIPEDIIYKKALILIGRSSVKRNGLYARIISLLNMAGLEHLTFEGIKSNPSSADADRATRLAKEFGAEVIIAIGGGSVIDTGKAISVGFYADHSVWDFYTQKVIPQKALPLICILTLAACGTENNDYSILQNDETGQKCGFSSVLLFPKVSILDPTFTFSVPAECTAYGISNLIAHCLEQFFGTGDSPISDYQIAAAIKLAIASGREAVANPQNYEARANLMWLSATALSGGLSVGKTRGDWGCHAMEQCLSILYDTQHGAGLSVIYPAWLKHHADKLAGKIQFLSKQVFDSEASADEAPGIFISSLENFFNEIKSPTRLSQLGVMPSEKENIRKCFTLNKASGKVYKLNEADYESLLDKMW